MNDIEEPTCEIGFIGGGNMAQAIFAAILNAEIAPAQRIRVSDPDPQQRAAFGDAGAHTTDDNNAVAAAAETLILAVKPQIMDEVVGGLAGSVRPDALVVSIAAGIPTSRLEGLLPAGTRVVRVMPNTPLMVGCGVTAAVGGQNATTGDMARVVEIFSAAGTTVQVEDEAHMHAVTALSGSGPAYVFRFIEAMTAAGDALGLPDELSRAMAAGTALGAANLLMNSGQTPATLRERVTSPGGTTEAALAVLEERDFAGTVEAAMRAAHQRSVELGGE